MGTFEFLPSDFASYLAILAYDRVFTPFPLPFPANQNQKKKKKVDKLPIFPLL